MGFCIVKRKKKSKEEHAMRKFKNVVRKSVYQRIMDEVYSPLYKRGWMNVPDMENVRVSRYNYDWVSDIVSEQSVQRMQGNTPLFIASQTGSGKTTFIFENCIPVAEKEGKKVLYLCNRTALKNQIKKEAMKNPWNNSTYVDGIKVAEYKEHYTEKGLSKEHKFGLIDIYAYQEIINFSQNKVDEYAVVVMDEAHFFLADAKFNPFTELILDIVTDIFKYTRRIYLSATPQESMGVIYETEKYCHKRTRVDMWQRIHNPMYNPEASDLLLDVIAVDEDYDYLQPRFFETVQELQKLILKNSETKWLVFVRAKDMASELMQKLNLPEGDITYYDADTDKELEQYKRLIENEDLTHRVTISTKVLDVGVNIKTENVNVVVFDDDPIEIKQMVGRKRVKPDADEKVLVYFHVPTIRELNKRKGCAETDLAEYQKTNEEYQRGIYASITSPLYIMNDRIYINYYYKVKATNDFRRYDELIDEMSKAEPNQAKYVYAEYILQQFHFKVPEIQKYFCNYEPKGEIAVKLRKCLSPYLDQNITKEDLNDLAERILKILPDPRTDKRSDRNIGIVSINKAIKPYGYVVESKKKTVPVSYVITLTDEGKEQEVNV